jgi:hypothetical protein
MADRISAISRGRAKMPAMPGVDVDRALHPGPQLRRAPEFTLNSVLVLSIRISVNITVFTLFNMVDAEPLPVRDSYCARRTVLQ